jgi:hypothetical protein
MFGTVENHAEAHAELRRGLERVTALTSSAVTNEGVSRHTLASATLSFDDFRSVANVVTAAYPAGSGYVTAVDDTLVVTASAVTQRGSKRRRVSGGGEGNDVDDDDDDDAILTRLAQLVVPSSAKATTRRHVRALRSLRGSESEEVHVKTVIQTRLMGESLRVVTTSLLAGGVGVSLRSLAASMADLDGVVVTRVGGETRLSSDLDDVQSMCDTAASSRVAKELGLPELVVVAHC